MDAWCATHGQLATKPRRRCANRLRIRCHRQADGIALRHSGSGGTTVDVRRATSDLRANSSRRLSDEVRHLHDRGAEARLCDCILTDSGPAQRQVQSAPSIRGSDVEEVRAQHWERWRGRQVLTISKPLSAAQALLSPAGVLQLPGQLLQRRPANSRRVAWQAGGRLGLEGRGAGGTLRPACRRTASAHGRATGSAPLSL